MSSPVYELLKRPDELFVVEHAHLQPRFVEDSVRHALTTTLDRYPDLADGDFLFSQQVNLETIHRHDVVAERSGTVGELRARARRRAPPRLTPSCATGSALLPERSRARPPRSRSPACTSGACPCSRRPTARTSSPWPGSRAASTAAGRERRRALRACRQRVPCRLVDDLHRDAEGPKSAVTAAGWRRASSAQAACRCSARSSGRSVTVAAGSAERQTAPWSHCVVHAAVQSTPGRSLVTDPALRSRGQRLLPACSAGAARASPGCRSRILQWP